MERAKGLLQLPSITDTDLAINVASMVIRAVNMMLHSATDVGSNSVQDAEKQRHHVHYCSPCLPHHFCSHLQNAALELV
jgi:hypothetical protein